MLRCGVLRCDMLQRTRCTVLHRVRCHRYSTDFFPKADDLVRYLADVVAKLKLNVVFNTNVLSVEKVPRATSPFEIRAASRNATVLYACKYTIMANGLSEPKKLKPDKEELVFGYESMPMDKSFYNGKSVYILGAGNSALETALHIESNAAKIHFMSRHGLHLGWKTHYFGDVRAATNRHLDAYQLKSLDGFLEGDAEKLVIQREPSGDLIVNNPADTESHAREAAIGSAAADQRLVLKRDRDGSAGMRKAPAARRLVQSDADAADGACGCCGIDKFQMLTRAGAQGGGHTDVLDTITASHRACGRCLAAVSVSASSDPSKLLPCATAAALPLLSAMIGPGGAYAPGGAATTGQTRVSYQAVIRCLGWVWDDSMFVQNTSEHATKLKKPGGIYPPACTLRARTHSHARVRAQASSRCATRESNGTQASSTTTRSRT
jgi:hypothetical protein